MPWEIDWYICRADSSDVKAAEERRQKDKTTVVPQVGNEFWRVAKSIGPIGVDHDHYAGWHLVATVEQAVTISLIPDMLLFLTKVAFGTFDCSEHQKFMAAKAEAERLLELLKTDPKTMRVT